jgi:hypothetical protein
MNAIKPLRSFAFAVLTASPTSVDEAVAEAAVLAAGLLRLHADLSSVGTSQDAELARVPGRLAENLGSVALAVCRWRHVHVVPPQGRIGDHGDTAKSVLGDRRPRQPCADERQHQQPRAALVQQLTHPAWPRSWTASRDFKRPV